jgi:glycosyltransferase involved in cell wall biosynthesis
MPSFNFNQADFIEKSIRSVLDQNVDGLELIVMDGGSTDGTLQVLEKLSLQSNSRLHWYSEADLGAAHALNNAFTLSRAPVIG